MKYLLIIVAFALASCNRPTEQEAVVRNLFLKHGAAAGIEKYDFSTKQTPDSIVYNRLIAHNTKMIEESGAWPYDSTVRLMAQKIDSLKNAKAQKRNKTFYTVRVSHSEGAHQTIKDFYLSDENKVIGDELIKFEP